MSINEKIIIFDLDGTLIDSFPGISLSFRHTLKELGIAELTDEQIRLAIGPGLHKALETLINTKDLETIENAVLIYRNFHDSEGYKESKIYPGVVELLEQLKEKEVRTFVASMKADHIIKPILKYLNLSHFFEEAIGANRDGSTASKAQMLEGLAGKFNFDLKDTVLVGDTYHDAKAAKNAGVEFFAVTYGYGLVSELEEIGYSRIFNSAYEISEYIVNC